MCESEEQELGKNRLELGEEEEHFTAPAGEELPPERETFWVVLHANIDLTSEGHVCTVVKRSLSTGSEQQVQAPFSNLGQCCDWLAELEFQDV